jgi:hypothetical protein
LALGVYGNFPQNVHFIKKYVSSQSSRQLQQKLIRQLTAVNRKEQSFEEVAIPTVPNSVVIFEFGLADEGDFTFLNTAEAEKALAHVERNILRKLDFFCSIRYYKDLEGKRQALKFDYFLLRTTYAKGIFEVMAFYERGPRYLSAEDLVEYIVKGVNSHSSRATLRELPDES